MPYYVVNVGRGRSSTHVMKSNGTWVPGPASQVIIGAVKTTLCGLTATRYVDVFSPSEASCRECKKRWQLAVEVDAAKIRNQPVRTPGKTASPAMGCLFLMVILLVVAGVITGIILLVVKGDRDAGYPAKGMAARIPGCTITVGTNSNVPDNGTSAAKCTLPDDTVVEILTWSNNPPDTTDQRQWAYTDNQGPLIAAGPLPDCCIMGTSPAPWVVDISGDEIFAKEHASDWSTVQDALGGQIVTNPPASWNPYPSVPSPPVAEARTDREDQRLLALGGDGVIVTSRPEGRATQAGSRRMRAPVDMLPSY
jgi:hypothetical protein